MLNSARLSLTPVCPNPECYNPGMKKTSAKRKMRQFTVVIEQDEDGYDVASFLSLPSCYTQARTL